MSDSTNQAQSSSGIAYPRYNYRDYGKFHPRDTIGLTSQAAFVSAGAGVMVAAIKASLGPPRGISAVMRNTPYIWLYTSVGTAYTFTEAVTANLTQRESAWNKFAGGAAAGAIMGATYRSVPKVIGGGLAVGTMLGLVDWTGGFMGYGSQQAQANSSGEVQEIEKGERQGFFEVVHRRPLSQTLEELGDLVRPHK